MDFEEILSSPAFWILGGVGVIMEVLGYIVGKNMGLPAFPLWQFIVLIIVTIIAAGFFASRE